MPPIPAYPTNQDLGNTILSLFFPEHLAIIVIRAGIWYTYGHLYNVVSGDAIDLAVWILVLVGVLVPMSCSVFFVPLRYVPSPGQPLTEGNVNDTSPEHASRLLVLQEWSLPEANSA